MARLPQNVFEELQRLGEQRQQVHKEVLLRLQNTLHTVAPGRASSAVLPNTAGLKRLTQVGSVGGGEPKRQRTGQNVDPGAEALWRQCGALIKKLWDSKHGITFHKPVDPVLFGIPNYFQVITRPMDFTTIKQKLVSYFSGVEFDKGDLIFRMAGRGRVFRTQHPGLGTHSLADSAFCTLSVCLISFRGVSLSRCGLPIH